MTRASLYTRVSTVVPQLHGTRSGLLWDLQGCDIGNLSMIAQQTQVRSKARIARRLRISVAAARRAWESQEGFPSYAKNLRTNIGRGIRRGHSLSLPECSIPKAGGFGKGGQWLFRGDS